MAQQREGGPSKLLTDLVKAALSGVDVMESDGVDLGYTHTTVDIAERVMAVARTVEQRLMRQS